MDSVCLKTEQRRWKGKYLGVGERGRIRREGMNGGLDLNTFYEVVELLSLKNENLHIFLTFM